jgi:hypothetical protein
VVLKHVTYDSWSESYILVLIKNDSHVSSDFFFIKNFEKIHNFSKIFQFLSFIFNILTFLWVFTACECSLHMNPVYFSQESCRNSKIRKNQFFFTLEPFARKESELQIQCNLAYTFIEPFSRTYQMHQKFERQFPVLYSVLSCPLPILGILDTRELKFRNSINPFFAPN